MKRGWLAALAGLAVAAGCSRLTVPRPTLGGSTSLDPPTSISRSTIATPAVPPSSEGLSVRLSDLPDGWVTTASLPPTSVESAVPHLAACLGMKLGALGGDALRQSGPVFRSADSKEWLTGSAGSAATVRGGSVPPAPNGALRICVAKAVVQDLVASGFGSVTVRAVSAMTGFSSIVARSLDVRVSTNVTVFGVTGVVFVDLVWLADNRTAATLEVVTQAFKGDLQAVDDGLIAQAADAVGRRISGL